MQSKATTVRKYLAELPAERRAALNAVRAVILANLDADYEEGMQYGMIGYFVPHRVYPPGYHCDPQQPLPFAGLASQKNYCSLYLMCTYADPVLRRQFERDWSASGKRLNMGKACVRFHSVDDVAFEAVAAAIRAVPAARLIAQYESVFRRRSKPAPGRGRATTAARKPRSPQPAAKSVKKKAKPKARSRRS